MTVPKAKKPQSRSEKKSIIEKKSHQATWIHKKPLPMPNTTTKYYTKNKSSGWSWLVFFVILIAVVVWWNYRDNLSTLITDTKIDTGKNISGANNLFVGKDITLEWVIERNNVTRYSYTHTLADDIHGTVWLRSSSLNLYELTGQVTVQGKVSDFINNMYIIEVTQVKHTDGDDSWSGVLYFSTPWLLLQNIAKDGFTVVQNTSTKTIAINNATTSATINIRYFVCTPEKTYDCSQFEASFQNTSWSRSVDNYGNIFYKLNDENTRFSNLDNRYGVYIETSNSQLFPLIIEKSQFITNEWTEKHLSTTAKTYCKQDAKRLQEITSGSLAQTTTWFQWMIDGTDNNFEKISCILTFNPEQLENVVATLIQTETTPMDNTTVQPEEPVIIDDEPSSPATTSTSLPSSSTTQFPLRPGKELLFSTRGMTVSFPSPNISFASSNISEWPNGMKCNAQTNVVEYAKKDQLSTNPSLVLYFCSDTGTKIDNTMRQISLWSTTIVIEAKDPSWINFANGITIN